MARALVRGVVALGELLDAQPDVAQERRAVGLTLGLRRRFEIVEVPGHRELDVHVELVALGEREREVGSPGAALDLGLLDVVDVLDEPRQAQDVFGHALAPLAACGRADERLAERAGRFAEVLGDLGVGAQGLVDLAELLGAGLAQRRHHGSEAAELGTHLLVDLVEPGIDDVLLRRQLGRSVLADLHRGGSELLALEDHRLLEGGPHGRVALDAGVGPHLGQRRIDRRLHGLRRIDGHDGAGSPPARDLDRDRGRDGTDRHHQEQHR